MIRSGVSPRSLSPALRGATFYFVHFAAFGAILPFINVYWQEIGLSGSQIGAIAAIGPVMTLFAAPPIAAYADRHRRRVATLVVSLLLSALVYLLFGLTKGYSWLLLIMIVFTLIRSPVLPLSDGLIARMAARHGLNFGGMRLWGSIGYATVAIAAGALFQSVGFQSLFLVGGVLLLPAALLGAQLEEVRQTIIADERTAPRLLLRDRGLLVLLLATFLVGVGMGMGINYEGIYMAALGGDEFMIGLLLGTAAYCEIPIMFYSDRIRERLGGIRTLILAYGLFALAYLGFAGATAVWVPLVFAVAKGLGIGLILTATVRVVDARVPEEWAATAQSLMTASLFGLSTLVASLVGGVLLDTLGARVIFAVGSGAALLAMLLIAVARRQGILTIPPIARQG